jgi:hypothetical protein
MFIYSSHGKWVFPLSCGVFLPLPLLQVFPLLVAGHVPLFLPSPAGLLWGIFLPPLRHSGCPALFATCLFCCYCLLFSFFSFFPGWGLVCPGGYADLAQGCLWELTLWSAFSQAIWAVPSGGSMGALLVSPFNVKSRCYVQTRGVEESKFCLFSVVFPVRCISSISSRFYFRRHAFCFLPLAAILESPHHLWFLESFCPQPCHISQKYMPPIWKDPGSHIFENQKQIIQGLRNHV